MDLPLAKESTSDVCADGGHAFVGIGVGPPQETELSMWVGGSQAKVNAEYFGSPREESVWAPNQSAALMAFYTLFILHHAVSA